MIIMRNSILPDICKLLFYKRRNVFTFRYVSNPIKVLGEIKAKGGNIETVEGEVIAGDAGDVDVVSIKGNHKTIFNNISLVEISIYAQHNM